MSPRIEKLREAIEVMHRCQAVHDNSLPVREMFRDQVVWEGVVETFNLTGHAKATRCYAWSYPDAKGETQFVTVLEIPPVKDQVTAVRASIVSEARSRAR